MEKALKKHAPIFVLPTFLAFVIGFIIPFAQGFYLSFCKFTTVGNATLLEYQIIPQQSRIHHLQVHLNLQYYLRLYRSY